MSGFQQLHIQENRIKRLALQGILEPVKIQQQAIPAILEGRDVLIEADPGTGKTLAYALPLLERIDFSQKELQAIIIAPTHELAMQILQVLQELVPEDTTWVQACMGGGSIKRQIEKLKQKPLVVVGTPGRIVDLKEQKKLKLHKLRQLVIDEIDRYIELEDTAGVEKVLKSVLRDTQKIFASATMPSYAQAWKDKWMNQPVLIKGKSHSQTQHFYVISEERSKVDMLRRIKHASPGIHGIVFVNENKKLLLALEKLKHVRLDIEALSGELQGQERASALRAFRDKKFSLLLCTDLAARGLDIEGLTHVVNYDLPLQAEHYIHRAGRTGRMGREGTVITLLTPGEQAAFRKLMKKLDLHVEERVLYRGQLCSPHGTGKH